MNNKGFAPIIVLVLVVMVAIGGYVAWHYTRPNVGAPTALTNAPSAGGNAQANAPVAPSSSTPNVPQDTSSALKTKASIRVSLYDAGNPLHLGFTCTVDTAHPLAGFIIYAGDGQRMIKSTNAKTFVYEHTYAQSGQYTVTCVPLYDTLTQGDASSPYAASLVVTPASASGSTYPERSEVLKVMTTAPHLHATTDPAHSSDPNIVAAYANFLLYWKAPSLDAQLSYIVSSQIQDYRSMNPVFTPNPVIASVSAYEQSVGSNLSVVVFTVTYAGDSRPVIWVMSKDNGTWKLDAVLSFGVNLTS